MKILYLLLVYLTLSWSMSFAIVDLYQGQKIIEDIGSAWMFNFLIANLLYLPSLLIYFFLNIQNKIDNFRLMAIALATILLFHMAIYAFGINLIFVVITQLIFVLLTFLFIKMETDKDWFSKN